MWTVTRDGITTMRVTRVTSLALTVSRSMFHQGRSQRRLLKAFGEAFVLGHTALGPPSSYVDPERRFTSFSWLVHWPQRTATRLRVPCSLLRSPPLPRWTSALPPAPSEDSTQATGLKNGSVSRSRSHRWDCCGSRPPCPSRMPHELSKTRSRSEMPAHSSPLAVWVRRFPRIVCS